MLPRETIVAFIDVEVYLQMKPEHIFFLQYQNASFARIIGIGFSLFKDMSWEYMAIPFVPRRKQSITLKVGVLLLHISCVQGCVSFLPKTFSNTPLFFLLIDSATAARISHVGLYTLRLKTLSRKKLLAKKGFCIFRRLRVDFVGIFLEVTLKFSTYIHNFKGLWGLSWNGYWMVHRI